MSPRRSRAGGLRCKQTTTQHPERAGRPASCQPVMESEAGRSRRRARLEFGPGAVIKPVGKLSSFVSDGVRHHSLRSNEDARNCTKCSEGTRSAGVGAVALIGRRFRLSHHRAIRNTRGCHCSRGPAAHNQAGDDRSSEQDAKETRKRHFSILTQWVSRDKSLG